MLHLNDLTYVIPARAGSVRIPNKNFREFGGVSLFRWSLFFALEVAPTSHVYLSTDKQDIAPGTAGVHGAQVIRRTPATSGSEATTEEWLREFIEMTDRRHQNLVVLQPTSPFRNTMTLVRMLEKFNQASSPAIYSSSNEGPNGNLYICSSDYVMSGGSLTQGAADAIPSEFAWETLDLDYEEDWRFGEQLLLEGVQREFHQKLIRFQGSVD